MVRYCGVIGCNNNDNSTENKVFYRFPIIRKNHYEISHNRYCKWLAALKLDGFTESRRKGFWICQDHFI